MNFDAGTTSKQVIVFQLMQREYALPLESTLEVLRMVAITPVPEGPAWLAGVINLRGQIIPVIDLRLRLRMPARDSRSAAILSTPIMIARVNNRLVGLIADAVLDVLLVPPEAISSPDELAGQDHAVAAIVHTDFRLIMLLDLPRLTAGSEHFG